MERSLLQRIEAFLKETAMPPTVFGRAAVRDPRLVSDLRGGREPGARLKHPEPLAAVTPPPAAAA